MSSVAEQVVAAAVVALNGAGKPAGLPTAERARSFALSEEKLPAQLVYFLEDEEKPVAGDTGPLVEHEMFLRVSCYSKGSATQGADEAADPMRAWAVKALHAKGTAIEVLVNLCRLKMSKASYSQGENALCRLDLDFRVEFQTNVLDAELVS